MDDDQRCMIAIADQGSISGAARNLHISQPAVSRRLHRLESRLGLVLFSRQARSIVPTHAGMAYLTYARTALQDETRLLRELSAIAGREKRRLKVGVSLLGCDSILPEVVQRFYHETNECNIVFVNTEDRVPNVGVRRDLT